MFVDAAAHRRVVEEAIAAGQLVGDPAQFDVPPGDRVVAQQQAEIARLVPDGMTRPINTVYLNSDLAPAGQAAPPITLLEPRPVGRARPAPGRGLRFGRVAAPRVRRGPWCARR
jgi:hypothetical protein